MKSLMASSTDMETLEKLEEAKLDITGAAFVQVQARHDNEVLWINVNGVCVLRICLIQELELFTF